MRFVIIGADAAGMSAASRAKRHQPELDVMVLEKTTDVSYSACGMPYTIADPERDIDELVVRAASVFREKQGINLLTGHCATCIDPVKKIVSGVGPADGGFEHPYDALLIATGATPKKPDRPGFDLPGVMVLKTLGDGRQIKTYLKANRVDKVVIVGMGYIALEMAEALRGLSLDVDMIKPGPVFLPWLEASLSQVVQAELEQHGVGLYPGKEIKGIERSGGRLTVVCADMDLSCDMVLVAAGIRPNSDIARAAGLQLSVSDSIAVDRRLRTSDPAIFAAGDCADAYHVVSGQKTWIPLALRANRAGWAAADNVCGMETSLDGVAGTAVFRTFHLEVAQTGLTLAEAKRSGFDPVQEVIQTRSRAHAHPGSSPLWVCMVGDKKTGRLLGVQMVGKEGAAHRINAPAVALHNRMTVADYSQTDLSYAPPFGPTWDPTLTAANQLLKKL